MCKKIIQLYAIAITEKLKIFQYLQLQLAHTYCINNQKALAVFPPNDFVKMLLPRAVKPLDQTAWYSVYKVVRKEITNAINSHLVLFPTSLSFHLIIKNGPDSGVHSANFPGQSISSFGLEQISELKRVPLPSLLKPNNNHTFSSC